MSKSGPRSKDPDPGLDAAQLGTMPDPERIGPFRIYCNLCSSDAEEKTLRLLITVAVC